MSIFESTDSSSTDSSDLDDELGDMLIVSLILEYERSFVSKIPCRTSMLTGKMYTLEFLAGHEARCYDSFRMEKHIFINFCNTLKDIANLRDGKNVSVEEGVAMFLIIVCHNLRHKVVAEHFQHSQYTINKWFIMILRAICKLGTRIIQPRH